MLIENYDEINARNVELARELKELEETCTALKEANKELRFENEDNTNLINKIAKIAIEKGQGTIVDRFDKIKELVQNYQSETSSIK